MVKRTALARPFFSTATFAGVTPIASAKDLVNRLLVEPDPSKRKGLYSQVNDIILDDAWLLIYATRPDHAVVSKKVHDFQWARHLS